MKAVAFAANMSSSYRNRRRRTSSSGSKKPIIKKGGAGGKTVWGKPGCEIDEVIMDSGDPAYDPSEDEPYRLRVSYPITQECTDLLNQVLPEFFVSGDTSEVVSALDEANFLDMGVLTVVHIVKDALDKKDSQRELASILISELVNSKIVGSEDVANAFEKLLDDIDDLILDTPSVVSLLAKFIARSVADDILPPSFVTRQGSSNTPNTPNTPVTPNTFSKRKDSTSSGHNPFIPDDSSSAILIASANANSSTSGGFLVSSSPNENGVSKYAANEEEDPAVETLQLAKALLNMKHGFVRLDNVWGVVGGRRTVKQLSRRIVLLLKEYTVSRDITEAERCVQELEVPHFHHEIVYEAVLLSIESNSKKNQEVFIDLLKSFAKSCILTPEQITMGFQRIFEDLPDITLDVPNAGTLFREFIASCVAESLISESVATQWKGL